MTAYARTLILPMKDEAPRLPDTVAALASAGLGASDRTELLFVDDGSTDGSAELATRLLSDHGLAGRVLRLGRNHGKGAAVRAGVYAATGNAIAFSDADLSAPVGAIERSFALIEAGGADVVVGTRMHTESQITAHQPWRRRWAGKAFNAMLRRLGLTGYGDTQCGLKAFTKDAANLLFRDLTIQRFAFDVELLLRAQLAGLRVVELPVAWGHVDDSRVRLVRDGARMMVDVVRLRSAIHAWENGTPTDAEERLPVIARLERQHWWFRARQELLTVELDRSPRRREVALEVGCSTGGVVEHLAGAGFDAVVGSDVSPVTVEYARGMGTKALLCSPADALSLRSGTFSHVVALDVLQHLQDDVASLREYRRVLVDDGVIVITVPAYEWAWSDHDVALGHRRRYTATRLEQAVRQAGFEPVHVTHFHTWLVPIAALLATPPLGWLVRRSAEEMIFVSPRWNRMLVAATRMERALLRHRRAPFGLSVMLLARRAEPA